MQATESIAGVHECAVQRGLGQVETVADTPEGLWRG